MYVSNVIEAIFVSLWLAYFSLAIAGLWRYRSWWRILPLAAASAVGVLFVLPYRHGDFMLVLLSMALSAVVAIKAWRGPSGFDRGLRVLSAFWFLWFPAAMLILPWA